MLEDIARPTKYPPAAAKYGDMLLCEYGVDLMDWFDRLGRDGDLRRPIYFTVDEWSSPPNAYDMAPYFMFTCVHTRQWESSKSKHILIVVCDLLQVNV